MIEANGTFITKARVLRWICPMCGGMEERGAPFPVKTGATLKTKISCTQGKREILVIVERVIP